MNSEWKNCLWGEIATLEYGKSLRNYSEGKGGVPVYGTNGPIGFTERYLSDKPGVIIGRKGAYRGVHYCPEPFFVIDTAFYLKPKNDALDIKYAYYQLLTQDINSMDSGSAIPSTSRDDFYGLEISLPPIQTQRRIASILTALDDKIELNRRMNETLEGIAQAMWVEWFGKYAGGEGLPEGAVKHTFEEHLDVDRGLSYKGDGLVGKDDDGIPMYNLNSVLEGGGFKYAGMKYYSGEYRERHLVNPGELIVTNTEQGHKYMLIGYPAVIPKMFGKGICSHHIYRVRVKPDSYLSTPFFYYLMMHPIIRDQIVGCANGTTVNMLKIDGLKVPEFYLPPEKLVQDFSELVRDIWDKQEENNQETRTLISLRDALLPRLMQGELNI